MTLSKAIERADLLRPNTASRYEKIRWLNELDGKIAAEIIATHVGGKTFSGYDENTDPDTVLLAPFPYDDIYLKYLFAQIDLSGRETENYNNSAAIFNAAYEAFAAWYNRTHMPQSGSLCYFGVRNTPEDAPVVYGDVNGDGTIDGRDLISLRKMLLDMEED